tara:strand:- start:1991 stop:2503 length:513 start_codon:yes stop_codon:yes gene_type:complete
MENYILEGNINFNEELLKLLCKEENVENEKKICLISGEELRENYVTLQCGHSFNYDSIFNELKNQRKKNRLESHKTSKNEIKCPYCRRIHNGILNHVEGYNKVLNVNCKVIEKVELNTKFNICSAIIKSGKRKGQKCGCKIKERYVQKGGVNVLEIPAFCGRHKNNVISI